MSSSRQSPCYRIGCWCCCSLWHCCTATGTTSTLEIDIGHLLTIGTSKTSGFPAWTVLHLHAWKREHFFQGRLRNICSGGNVFYGGPNLMWLYSLPMISTRLHTSFFFLTYVFKIQLGVSCNSYPVHWTEIHRYKSHDIQCFIIYASLHTRGSVPVQYANSKVMFQVGTWIHPILHATSLIPEIGLTFLVHEKSSKVNTQTNHAC